MKRHTFTILAVPLSLAIMTLGACHAQRTLSPKDYLPLTITALQGGETAARIAQGQAQGYEGCVAATVMAEAFDASTEALSAGLNDGVTYPAITVDLQACQALPHETPEALNEGPSEAIDVLSSTVFDVAGFYAARLRAHNCPHGAAAQGAIAYLRHAKIQLLVFLRDSRSTLRIEPYEVDFTECD